MTLTATRPTILVVNGVATEVRTAPGTTRCTRWSAWASPASKPTDWGSHRSGISTDIATQTKVETATQITVGSYKRAVRPSGGAECWGQDVCKRDGEAEYAEYELHRLDVPGLEDPVQVDGGAFSVCALDRDGEVFCHGYRHVDDRCYIDGWERVSKVERAVEIAVIRSSACALEESGLVSCWGGKGYDHLGVEVEGTERLRDPVPLTQLSPVYRLRSYDDAACVLRANGEIWCWGHFMRNTGNQVTPQRIDVDPAIDKIVGDAFGCALLPDHSVRCFGRRIDRWQEKYFPSAELPALRRQEGMGQPPDVQHRRSDNPRRA